MVITSILKINPFQLAQLIPYRTWNKQLPFDGNIYIYIYIAMSVSNILLNIVDIHMANSVSLLTIRVHILQWIIHNHHLRDV